jgi:hypothetical protein
MIRHEIKLYKNYQIKSFKEYHNGILIDQETYDKNGKLKESIKYFEDGKVRDIIQVKRKYTYLTAYYNNGRTIRRKAKFIPNKLVDSYQIDYDMHGNMTEHEIYKKGIKDVHITYQYATGSYCKFKWDGKGNLVPDKIKPITPNLLKRIAPNWKKVTDKLQVGHKCFYYDGSIRQIRNCVVTKIISWYEVEVTDIFDNMSFIKPMIYLCNSINTKSFYY